MGCGVCGREPTRRVQGLGFRVEGSGFGVCGSGLGVLRITVCGVGVQGLGFKVTERDRGHLHRPPLGNGAVLHDLSFLNDWNSGP